MITKVKLTNVASYDSDGVIIDNLDKFNFIYGNNGCGKSTLSKVLKAPEVYPECIIETTEESFRTLVYNKDFIKNNFNQSNEIPGIFTLGADAVSVQQEIKIKEDQLNHANKQKPNKEEQVLNEIGKLNKIETDFIERTWELKKKYDAHFSEVLTGVRGSKTAFKQSLVSKMSSFSEDVETLEDLIKEISIIFKQTPIKLPEFRVFDKSFIEAIDKNIFSEKIVGNQDLDISDMIRSLNLDDWVLTGKGYLQHTNNKCPFCQQDLPKLIQEQIESYFDKTYYLKIEHLKKSFTLQETKWNELESYLADLTSHYELLIDSAKYTHLCEKTKQIKEEVLNLFKVKISEPSLVLRYPNMQSYLDEINEFMDILDDEITSYNLRIDNLSIEKQKTINKVWNFLLNDIKPEYDRYIREQSICIKARDGKKRAFDKVNESIEKLKLEIMELKASVIGIDESVSKINNQLISFGFTNFKLEITPENGVYKIVRPNGEMAEETLSEGEKTFITFLYYYNSVFGTASPDEEETYKVLVIDDPISSLDSKVLFIVSTLIQNLIRATNREGSFIKQVFVLTHNTYFYKEVTNRIKDNCTHHILTKHDDITRVISYQDNPIRTSYQLLWDELRISLDSSVSITQNIMRRILENYFSFAGNIPLMSLTKYFEGDEIDIFKSLIAWLHDGSHAIFEDLYIGSVIETKHLYYKVFKEIFIKTRHEAHFIMMLETTFTPEERSVFEFVTPVESLELAGSVSTLN